MRRATVITSAALVLAGTGCVQQDKYDNTVISARSLKEQLVAAEQDRDTARANIEEVRGQLGRAQTTNADLREQVTEVDADRDSFFRYSGIYLRNTSLGNLLGLCAVSVPCGFSADGLPIGLMVYAKPFDEAMALRVAYAYQQATEWRTRRPDLSWAA